MTDNASSGQEFKIIEQIFRPLAASHPGTFNLTDDAAIFSPPSGKDLVVTKDAMVAGVHFLENDNPQNIARKLLRTNLSDIAAMGGKAYGYLLATAWPQDLDIQWVRDFAAGLADDQRIYGVTLMGGDTVKTPGPMTLSLTLFGTVPKGQRLLRSGANVGDLICVSGTIGDAALGLKAVLGEIPDISKNDSDFLENRYYLPRPRCLLGPRLLDLATSCLDVSDGLLADLGHIVSCSAVSGQLSIADIPLSDSVKTVLNAGQASFQDILSGGDDYELLFTIPSRKRDELQRLENECAVPISVIGKVKAGDGVHVLDENGALMSFARTGWQHL
ncbi:MAG: thiamine-phosphate kinase [Sneathiella sp.]|nr:thiamine-phosphate kinase [Sneathiella sp.]